MFWSILSVVAPKTYRTLWNRQFIKGMEKHRLRMYELYPSKVAMIDDRIAESYQRWLKKPGQ